MEFKRKGDKKTIIVDDSNNTVLLKYRKLEETGLVKHGVSTRIGGVSKDHLYSLNLSYSRGDKKENVDENFKRVAKSLGCEVSDITCVHQTHTANIKVIYEADRGKGFKNESEYDNTDGLITNVKGIMLSAYFADCVPIFLLDPVNKAVGMIHSGWRGTVQKISKNALIKMNEEYGTKARDIIAAIGPSICRDCYEVSKDVRDEFLNNFSKEQVCDIFCPSVKSEADDKYQLDLWLANKYILLEAGVLKENIEVTDICTCCNSELLFSHRASNGKRGNIGGFIGLI